MINVTYIHRITYSAAPVMACLPPWQEDLFGRALDINQALAGSCYR